MRAIRSRDTAPELLVRRELWRRGIRYRLGQRVCGARPDMLFRKARLAVFIDGCFWHGCPVHYRPPVGNADYWRGKIGQNQARDRRNDAALNEAGWIVKRFWECVVLTNPLAIADEIADMLLPPA